MRVAVSATKEVVQGVGITRADLERTHGVRSDGATGCGKPMRPLAVRSRVASSEWYCAECHDSLPMDLPVAELFLENERASRKGAA